MTKPIVVVGSINLDLVARAATIPRPGETLIGDSFRTFHGGKGANQAVAAARLGHPVTILGNVGDDSFGEELRSALRESGVSVEAIGTTPGASGVALILISSTGQNSIVVVPGANGLLSPSQLENHASVLQSAGILLAQLEIPIESVEFLSAFAERNSIPFLLDPAPARDLPASLLRRVTWLTPNETEADTLLNATNLSTENPIEAANALAAKGPRNVILKLGARGCVLRTEGQPPESIPAFTVNSVDTTAAGDAFAGAFAVAHMRGSTPKQAVRFASAVAAISVTRHGAQPSMPANSEVLTFLTDNP